jgi:hypothetical protein
LVIARQLRGEALRGKRLVVLPLVLVGAGALSLSDLHHPGVVALACIAASGLVAALIGIAQGNAMQLESREGGLWGKLPSAALWLWGALLLSRLAFVVLAELLGAHAASSLGSIVLVFGVNRLAQASVVALRAMAAGIPFAPEQNGASFAATLFGAAAPARSLPGSRAAVSPRLGWAEAARLLGARFAARA